MQPATQVKLLRVLQERSFRRLGGRQEQSVDVRVIAATNLNPDRSGPQRQAARGSLLPPQRLRDRAAAAARSARGRAAAHPALPQRVQRHQREGGQGRRPGGDADPRAVSLARQHPRAAQRHRARDDPGRTGTSSATRHLPPLLVTRGEETLPTMTLTPGTTVDEAERRLILLTLDHTRNNKTRAAEILGISLKTLHNKLNRMKEEEAGGSEEHGATDVIKSRQVAGVTTLVVFIVAALSAYHLATLARLSLRGERRRAASCCGRRSSSARARSCRPRRIPTRRCSEDGGIRSLLQSSVAYSHNVTYAAIVNRDGVAVAHSFPIGGRASRSPTRRTWRPSSIATPSRCCATVYSGSHLRDPPAAALRRPGSSARSGSASRRSSSRTSCSTAFRLATAERAARAASSRRSSRCCWRSGCCGRSTSSRAA